VALVHGDSHYFRVDKPLLDAAGNRIESNRIENFPRAEVSGDNAESGSDDVPSRAPSPRDSLHSAASASMRRMAANAACAM
jgi:hypothetical protein